MQEKNIPNYYSTFQIDEPHHYNQNLVGTLHTTSLLWSTGQENRCKQILEIRIYNIGTFHGTSRLSKTRTPNPELTLSCSCLREGHSIEHPYILSLCLIIRYSFHQNFMGTQFGRIFSRTTLNILTICL